jgi:hypothetical protein
MFERAEKQQDVAERRTRAHQADAPQAPGKGSKPCTDLDVEFLEQPATYRRFVDRVRDAHGVKRP